MPTLFDVKIGDSQSAIEEKRGEDERVQVRGGGGRFFVQENTVAEDGRQLNKQTIGRGSRDVDRQIDRARSRVSERIDGIDPVTFEREIPTGRFAPEGTQPDASVPSDRGPDGRFVSGQRKPVDSFGRREDSGIFWPFHKSVPSTPQQRVDASHPDDGGFGSGLFDSEERDILEDEFQRATDSFDEIGSDDRGSFFDTAAELRQRDAEVGLDTARRGDRLAVDTTNTLLGGSGSTDEEFGGGVENRQQLGQTRAGPEPERFHTTEIEFGGEVVDLTDRDREDLETFDKMLSRNVDAEVEAQRARGGTRPSELAQDFAQRQGAVSAEIQFRREMEQFGGR